MISKIDICNAASFGSSAQSLDGLKKFNYFFGSNGSGKTTISNIIAGQPQYIQCNITWENGLPLETRVYNRDFVDRNFNSQRELKGVFTLGEQEIGTLQRIDSIKQEIDSLVGDIKRLTNTLQGDDGNGGKLSDLSQLESIFKDRFWTQKQKYDSKLAGGLEGVRKSKDSFKAKVLAEFLGNTAILLPIGDLEKKAEKIFSKNPTPIQKHTVPQTDKILAYEQNPILKKIVIGKDDVDIAAIIKKLGNSDWVRQGLSYYETNNGICPFCQQNTDESLAKSLKEYFNESFENDNTEIDNLMSDYTSDSTRLQQQIQALIDSPSEFLDIEKLKDEKHVLDSLIVANIQRLEQKKKEISRVVDLNSIKNLLSEIKGLVINANKKIDEHNAIIENLENEKKALTRQIWKFIIDELKIEIEEYNKEKKNLDDAISNLSAQIVAKQKQKNDKTIELRELERQTTSIQPTLDGINALLSSFGFINFSLTLGDDGKTYKLIRESGNEAQSTLSEGEKNFVTFLYFYYLLKGSQSESGMTTDKVVVFDDPVSSLDSDVLFIVSSLIRELIEDVRNSRGNIKQIFILTHNIYFHKEVTFNTKRREAVLNEETFWLVKKQGKDSNVEKQIKNPIRTSYELLWEEIRNDGNCNNATIQNTLRRILENYFKLLGGIPLDELYNKFEREDRITCKALCSWVNDGSHSVFDDDYYTPLDDASVQRYRQIFRQIFEKCDQIAHYNMMMGINQDLEETG